MVQRGRAKLDQRVVGTGLGIQCVLVAKDLGPAVLMDSHRFHVTIRP